MLVFEAVMSHGELAEILNNGEEIKVTPHSSAKYIEQLRIGQLKSLY